MLNPEEPIVTKMDTDQRLYNIGACTYVALENLAGMATRGEGFVAYECGPGEDVTRSILMPITPTTEH